MIDVNELRERLIKLDEEIYLTYEGKESICVVVGGGALLLFGYISRATLDIDVLLASREIIPFFDKYDINMKVSSLIYRFPYNFEDRLIKIGLDTKAVKYYSLSLEDLVVSKLYSGRIKDQQDIGNIKVLNNIDWEQLDNLIIEAKMSTLNEREYSELLSMYNEYKNLKEW